MNWFDEACFGIFIHWGLWTVPAYDDIKSATRRNIKNGSEHYLGRLLKNFNELPEDKLTKVYHDLFMSQLKKKDDTKIDISKLKEGNSKYGKNDKIKTYYKFKDYLYGKSFDTDKICKQIKDTGAKYLVFTAKHHDGFCNWNTKTTEQNIMNTPLGRDVLLELRTSAKKHGLKFGIYYSWMEFTSTFTDKYIKHMWSQLEELKSYDPDLWWMDGDWRSTSKQLQSKKFVEYVRKTGAIINNRLGKEPDVKGDYNNFADRYIPDKEQKERFECCESIGIGWGYNRYASKESVKSGETLYKIYKKVTSMNGNLLLNIAPDANFEFDKNELESLLSLSKLKNIN